MKYRTLQGLTLLETLITMGMFLLIMTALVGSVRFFYETNRASIEQAYHIDEARRGIEFLVRDLREAGAGADGSYVVANIGSTTMTFYSDSDNDSSSERVQYTLDGSRLMRHILTATGTPPVYSGSGATSTVSIYVRNDAQGVPIFRYYDASGEEVLSYSAINTVRTVVITVIIDQHPLTDPEALTLRSSATIRNLRNE